MPAAGYNNGDKTFKEEPTCEPKGFSAIEGGGRACVMAATSAQRASRKRGNINLMLPQGVHELRAFER